MRQRCYKLGEYTMLRCILLLCFTCALFATTCFAIEPSYKGPLGNPEEPALRPYKWFFRGIMAFAHQTKEKFVEGNMNTPILGTVETSRGIRNGSTEFLYSFWKGILFTCPPQQPKFYQEKTELTKKVEADDVWRNVTDMMCSGPAFPMLVALDHVYVESDEKVRERLETAKEIQRARRDAQKARELKMSPVEKAQINYLCERAIVKRDKSKKYPKNLLKLAK